MAATPDVAAYIVSMSTELRKLAESAELQVLALILEMAALEASRSGDLLAVERLPKTQV